MKKIIAILLCMLMVMSFAGCTIGNNASFKEEEKKTQKSDKKTETAEKTYDVTFDGLKKCLKDKGLIKGDGKEVREEIIGAKKGLRYTVDDKNIVEIYEFNTSATPDEAVKLYDTISKDKVYSVLDGMSELKGAVSKSGKFVVLYPKDSKSDKYAKIVKELEKF